jgi:hypothetical protein
MYIKAINNRLEALPLDQAARINELLITKGVVYIPWENRQEELAAAYVPLTPASNGERVLSKKAAVLASSVTNKIVNILDKSGDQYYPEKTKNEKEVETLVDFVIFTVKNPITSEVQGFRKLAFWEKWATPYKRAKS